MFSWHCPLEGSNHSSNNSLGLHDWINFNGENDYCNCLGINVNWFSTTWRILEETYSLLSSFANLKRCMIWTNGMVKSVAEIIRGKSFWLYWFNLSNGHLSSTSGDSCKDNCSRANDLRNSNSLNYRAKVVQKLPYRVHTITFIKFKLSRISKSRIFI